MKKRGNKYCSKYRPRWSPIAFGFSYSPYFRPPLRSAQQTLSTSNAVDLTMVEHCQKSRLQSRIRLWPIGIPKSFPHRAPLPMYPPLPSIRKPKHKRVRLCLGDQAELARQLRLGTGTGHLMRTFKVSRRTIFNIKKISMWFSGMVPNQPLPWLLRPNVRLYSQKLRKGTNSLLFVVSISCRLIAVCYSSTHCFSVRTFCRRTILQIAHEVNCKSLRHQGAGQSNLCNETICGPCVWVARPVASMLWLWPVTWLPKIVSPVTSALVQLGFVYQCVSLDCMTLIS